MKTRGTLFDSEMRHARLIDGLSRFSHMATSQGEMITMLIEEGKRRLIAPRQERINFETGLEEAEKILNDLEHFPHFFVLACVMDRQVRAGRAWAIPYRVGKETGGFEFLQFLKLSLGLGLLSIGFLLQIAEKYL